jgi:antitoxin (DNA-binding transcriptional repressor) of toxin-antitoxin stability system
METMVAERLTAADLANRSSEVVEGIRTGKRYLVVLRNTVIGEIIPISEKSGIMLRDLEAEFAYLPPLDDDFGHDVRSARMNLLPNEPLEWPD